MHGLNVATVFFRLCWVTCNVLLKLPSCAPFSFREATRWFEMTQMAHSRFRKINAGALRKQTRRICSPEIAHAIQWPAVACPAGIQVHTYNLLPSKGRRHGPQATPSLANLQWCLQGNLTPKEIEGKWLSWRFISVSVWKAVNVIKSETKQGCYWTTLC